MIDRRAVMKALELEIRYPNGWDCRDECPYYGRTDCDCDTQVARDVLELLKEQEPKRPIASEDSNSFRRYNCPKCGRWFEFYKPAYCDKCGQAVKWDDSDRNGNA